ncbi:glycosyl transferase family 2 [Rhodococcus sp. SMB37]|uniref:glycosyltransferase n=1 Tax=Rhodococcus sp. SMB37 TaxID=2512213 RepID=UPI00104C4243|nr:glycosyltransferase family A protein [Rhodococcus sp. SMB37]TCN52848.1 glycosyl transferase family 2 [Rhodococcus sp. SMB37]
MVTRAGLSVIVPVHNEERYIGPCLDALIEQQHDLVDIVVVDNNCTDSTVDVVRRAQERCPKIKLVQESKPGVAHARNAGFEAADGDILGRVDADTRVRPHWARAVCDFFGRGDTEEVGAISGLNNSYDSPYRRIKGWYVEKQVQRGIFGGERPYRNLHGANMAIRRAAWEKVRDDVSVAPDIHEDLDLALCLGAAEVSIVQLSDMRVDISPRRALTPPREFRSYIESGVKTFDLHGRMTPEIRRAVRLHEKFHVLVYAAYRPYDPELGRFSLRALLGKPQARTMPVSEGVEER